MTDDSSACRQAVPADQDRGPGLAAALQGFMPPGAAPVAQRAWMVGAWDGVRWSPPDDAAPWAQWRHLSTIVLDGGEAGRAHGESIWTTEVEGRPVGAAWEWIEWQPGVVILKDPMSIVSNLAYPVGDDDADGPRSSRIMALNTIAHALPWQAEVVRRLPRRASAGQASPGTAPRTARSGPVARAGVQLPQQQRPAGLPASRAAAGHARPARHAPCPSSDPCVKRLEQAPRVPAPRDITR